jgi:NDP-sugar pyrophosphorylase family protein
MAAEPSSPAVGVIMAGGQGLRMQTSGAQTIKPLVTVLGAPLVERNVMSLIRSGIVDVRVVVATGPRAEPIAVWCVDRGVALLAAAGGRMTVVKEDEPLGNCGGLALATRGDLADAVLLFADNLTDLDLASLVRTHRERGAALTLAVHDEPFRLPYGVVDVADGVVTAYREKPTLSVSVSSGVAVASLAARELLAGPAGLSDLANNCVRAGHAVLAHRHSARWVDVNDTDKIEAAESMIRSAPAAFEVFWPSDVIRPTTALDDSVAQLDDLDSHGRPVRVSTTGADPEASLSISASQRIRAWQSPQEHSEAADQTSAAESERRP